MKKAKRELEISIPAAAVVEVPVEVVGEKDSMNTPLPVPVPAPVNFYSIVVTVEYEIPAELLNYGPVSIYRNRPGTSTRFIQLTCISDEAGRRLMPCLDESGERISNWDLEYSVIAGGWQDCFDRIHVVSSGVLCQQVSVHCGYFSIF